jgi:anti-sigma-K factor RskA
MRSANRPLVDRLAAEYVLGTLRGRARRHFERWLVSPQVGTMVKQWEGRLAGLEPPIERVLPAPEVWRGIERRLALRRAGGTPVARRLAIAASLLFCALLGLFAVYWRGTQPPPATQLASIQEPSSAQNAATIYWRVELLGDNQQLMVQVRSAHALEPGKSLELWVLPAPGVNDGKPVSLGVLPTQGEQRRVLSAAQRAALAGARNLAVSLEPAGGSPTGLPTGPVLHVAPLVRA